MTKTFALQIQPRDIKIIELICEFGYLTIQHLMETGEFSGYRAAHRRIKMLCDNGTLHAHPRTLRGYCQYLYYPNLDAAKNLIEKDLLPRVEKVCFFKPWLNRNKHHEDVLRTWAIKIKRVFPEAHIDLDFMLYNNRKLGERVPTNIHSRLPDMVVYFDGKNPVNFEIELTLKSSKRYLQRIRELMYGLRSPTIYLTDAIAIRERILHTQRFLIQTPKTIEPKTQNDVHVLLFNEIQTDKDFENKITVFLENWGYQDPFHGGKGLRKGDTLSELRQIAL